MNQVSSNRRERGVGAASRRLERLTVDEPGEGQDGEGQEQSLRAVKDLLRSQQQHIEELLLEQRELVEKEQGDGKHKFSQTVLQKQYEVNKGFTRLAKKIQKSLDKQQVHLAKNLTEDLINDLEEHQEDLIAADISRNGWLTVARIRNRCSLPKNILREIEKADDQIDSRRSKFRQQPRQDGRISQRTQPLDREAFGNSVKTFKPFNNRMQQKKSPEETLQEAARQTRAGQCSHCHENGHFFRECAEFWSKVKEVRKAHALKK